MSLLTSDRVLVPIDFSETSLQMLDETIKFFPDSCNIYVLYVLPRLLPMEPGVIWQTVTDETRTENVEKIFYQRYPKSLDTPLHFEVKIGDPGSEIIDYAQSHNINLIVIASHGNTGLNRFLLGSVAERVVRFAKCPVLVWRSPQKQK
ncbi:UspA domain protein [Rippkaea orientalis PCC 8801]|uniref:UspA domain protein n=1 Tax=Rippkaea orientalis (strain PCC 8801 / RF-1) TaxID=41431 RepID=B7K5D4_RIPO1|nr:universal stress protein [Rippkaea orientalis]ACK67960.1 UspA domain protein [Rippkaea orientalis PCC 8801]